jgi:hypothetical protein
MRSCVSCAQRPTGICAQSPERWGSEDPGAEAVGLGQGLMSSVFMISP